MLVRNTLRDPLVDLQLVVRAISTEPLISSKLLKLANSVSYNPSGRAHTDLRLAVARLGFEIVRTTSLAVAMDQMLKSKNLTTYDQISHAAWRHSMQVAAIARVLARRIGRINATKRCWPDWCNIGIFYLLYRAAEYPEYRDDQPAMLELLAGWHESMARACCTFLACLNRSPMPFATMTTFIPLPPLQCS